MLHRRRNRLHRRRRSKSSQRLRRSVFLVVLVLIVAAVDKQVQKARQAAFARRPRRPRRPLPRPRRLPRRACRPLPRLRRGCPALPVRRPREHRTWSSASAGASCAAAGAHARPARRRRSAASGRSLLVGRLSSPLEVLVVLVVVVLIVLVLVRALAAQAVADGVAGTGEEGKDGAEGVGVDRLLLRRRPRRPPRLPRRNRNRSRQARPRRSVLLRPPRFRERPARPRPPRPRRPLPARGASGRARLFIACAARRGRLPLPARRSLDSLRASAAGCACAGCARAPALGADAIGGPLRLFLRMPAAETLVPFDEQIVVQIGAIFPVSCHRNDRLSFRPAARGCCLRAFTAGKRQGYTDTIISHSVNMARARAENGAKYQKTSPFHAQKLRFCPRHVCKRRAHRLNREVQCMLRNDYRRALIMFRPLEQGYSGHARLERRTLMGTLCLTASAPGAAALRAALVGRRGNDYFAAPLGGAAPRQPRPVCPHRLVRPEEHRGKGAGGVPAAGGRRCGRPLPPGALRQRLRLGADGLGARAPRGLRAVRAGRERAGSGGRARHGCGADRRGSGSRPGWANAPAAEAAEAEADESAPSRRTRSLRKLPRRRRTRRTGWTRPPSRTRRPWKRLRPTPVQARPPWKRRRRTPLQARAAVETPPSNDFADAPAVEAALDASQPMAGGLSSRCAPSLMEASRWKNRRWRAMCSCARTCPRARASTVWPSACARKTACRCGLAYAFPGDDAPAPPAGLEGLRVVRRRAGLVGALRAGVKPAARKTGGGQKEFAPAAANLTVWSCTGREQRRGGDGLSTRASTHTSPRAIIRACRKPSVRAREPAFIHAVQYYAGQRGRSAWRSGPSATGGR